MAKKGRSMLEIENLVVSYGRAKALHGVNLKIEKGAMVAVLGCNGAGKSTLLKSISGLLKAGAGSHIGFEGRELTGMSPEKVVMAGIAHVPEGRKIFGNLTVTENLRMGAYTGRDKKNIADNMEFSYTLFPRLKERMTQYAGTLSGGEQQMLAIARALMSNPTLLLLDEPSMGLAPVIVERIYENLGEINRERRLTMVIVEQNASQAMESCGYAYVITNGKITLEGKRERLMNDSAFIDSYMGVE